ncbi:MAG: phage tail protein, partial [Thermoleophilia bacterium]|nr:phage tail protein [Thermoleophilia bacterium]
MERDEPTAAIAAYNLAPFSNARVEHADADSVDLSGVGGVYLDPARRDGARRLKDPADWSPSLEFAFELARRMPVGVKLGPAIDRGLIPPGAEAQWVSVDREVVELGLWFGSLARDGVTRSALVLSDRGGGPLAGGPASFGLPGLDRPPVAIWFFRNALPEKLQGPGLNAKSNEI